MTKDPLWALLAERALHTGQHITLSSGKESTYYFDCKPVTLSAAGAPLVGDAFVNALEGLPGDVTAVGGLTHGADPIIGAVMLRAFARGRALDGFYVRKQPKSHGTRRLQAAQGARHQATYREPAAAWNTRRYCRGRRDER